jgi:very-short-patch-repair endonuclease
METQEKVLAELTPTQKELKRLQRQQTKDGHQHLLFLQLKQYGLPLPTPEYQFHPTRHWKIDFAWLHPSKVALEVEGGVYTQQGGGHRSISGWDANLEKYNQLAVHGWLLIRVTPEMLGEKNGKAIALIREVFENLGF